MANTKRKDYTEVLLEDLRSQFKAFGEGLDVVSRQTEEVNLKFDRFEQRFDKEFFLVHREIMELRNC